VLVEVAARLQDAVRQNDAIGRRAAIAAPFAATTLPVSASIGIAVWSARSSRAASIDDLLNTADDAMYRAKAAGKNRVELARV
jgi:diguanylate cyclase (GGDEF)-like protein